MKKFYLSLMAFAVAFTFWACDPEDLPVELTCTVAKTDVTVYGGNDGTITVTVVTGNEGYEFSLTSTTTVTNATGNFTGLVAGDYSVSVKDSKNKTWQKDVTIGQAAPSELSVTLALDHVTCHSGNNGKITVTASGGILTYVYKLGDGNYQDGNTFESLTAGDYSITVKSGDFVVTKNATITQPAALNATHTVVHPTSPGANGTITISATGGTTPYQYKLNDGEYQSSNTFNPTSGTHTVTVTDANSCGPVVISGITLTDPVPPTVTTKEITNITPTSAVSGGNVVSDGGLPVTARGVVWSNSEEPTLESNSGYTTDGEGTGEFVSSVTELTPNTTYYLRAYGSNIAGTGYGTEISFTTKTGIIELTTSEVINISATSAESGGTIISDGGADVIVRGVVWSTIQNPTIESNNGITNDSTGTGSYKSFLMELDRETTYNIRAYATNSIGTFYGEQFTFTTLDGIISISTSSVTNITGTSAISGGTITSDGGSPIILCGLVWSTSQNPTIDSNQGISTNDSGTGSFISQISELKWETQYYVRAYATNSFGTAYGNQLYFTTTSLQIGNSYGGGIVAYIFQATDPGYVEGQIHGLITSQFDQGQSTWGCYGTYIGGTSTALGTGMDNTLTIVNGCSQNNIASLICYNLVINGYDDWYLPSLDELMILYTNKNLIGGFDPYSYYWSSSEISNVTAYGISFSSGFIKDRTKYNTANRVRAVRSF